MRYPVPILIDIMFIEKSIFYSYENCLKHSECLYYFICGERGNGKTYGFKKIALTNFIEKKELFVYIRRFQKEVTLSAKNFFNDIKTEFPEYKFKSTISKESGVTFFCSRNDKSYEVCGYGLSLNTGQEKSISYEGVTTICFDEYQSNRYLKKEVENYFLEIYETISRLNDVPVFLLSNSKHISNPYHDYFELKLPYGNKNYSIQNKGLIYFEITDNEEYRKIKRKTKFGKLIEDTSYGYYAIENKFVYDNSDFIRKKSGKLKCVCVLKYYDNTFGLWFDRLNGNLFLDNTIAPNTSVYALTNENRKENMFYVSRGKKIAWLNLMIQGYEQGFLFYNNQRTKRIGMEILRLIM